MKLSCGSNFNHIITNIQSWRLLECSGTTRSVFLLLLGSNVKDQLTGVPLGVGGACVGSRGLRSTRGTQHHWLGFSHTDESRQNPKITVSAVIHRLALPARCSAQVLTSMTADFALGRRVNRRRLNEEAEENPGSTLRCPTL